MTKIGIVLSGCGVNDGSEIHEATLTLLHVVKAGATPVFMAPNRKQVDVIDHAKGEAGEGSRNILVEGARIARGEIKDMIEVSAGDIDALIFPGGFGAAKNLSNFALVPHPADAKADEDVERLVKEMLSQGKPMGFICIAPASVAAVVLRDKKIKLTCGTDEATAKAVAALGNEHVQAEVDEIVTDEVHKIVSTPAYMLAQNIAEADEGICKLVAEVMEMVAARKAKAA